MSYVAVSWFKRPKKCQLCKRVFLTMPGFRFHLCVGGVQLFKDTPIAKSSYHD